LKRIKILLVQDDPRWEATVTHALNRAEDLIVIGSAHSREDAVRFVQKLDIDILLMDAMLNGGSSASLDTALEIHALHTSKMVMLTFQDHRDLILEAFSNGVTNIIVSAKMEEIPTAIRAVYADQSSIHFIAARILRQEYMRMKRLELRNSLTATESGILRLIFEGYTQTEISRRLHISESTVKKHANKTIKKLGTKTSKAAACKAKMKEIL
jgi:two-component system response regulator DevR